MARTFNDQIEVTTQEYFTYIQQGRIRGKWADLCKNIFFFLELYTYILYVWPNKKYIYIYKLTEETAKNIKFEVADSFTCLVVSIIRVLDFFLIRFYLCFYSRGFILLQLF
jgi:hypothetical protein